MIAKGPLQPARRIRLVRCMSVCALLLVAAPPKTLAEVTVRDLIDGYDYNTTLIEDLVITFSYTFDPSAAWEECKRETLPLYKRLSAEAIEAGYMEPFVGEDGVPMRLADVPDTLWLNRFYPVLAREEPVRSHRYMEKQPVFRWWENGAVSPDGTFVTEYRVSFDGTNYRTVSPPLQRGGVSTTVDFHAIEEPRTFLPAVDQRRWPDFARVPPENAELRLDGVEHRNGHDLYRITHTSYWNAMTQPNVVVSEDVDTTTESFRALLRSMNRDRHVFLVDPQRGFQVVEYVFESALRRTPEESFEVTRRTVLDDVTLQSDAAGQAWFVTDARIREYVTDPRGRWPTLRYDEERWPPDLILKGTSRLVTHECKINEGIPNEAFVIDFPDGYGVYDEITGVAYVVGGVSADDAIRSAVDLLKEAEAAAAIGHNQCWIHPAISETPDK